MRVYVVRHGQSTANLEGVHAGWNQVPLTEKGRKDAENSKRILQGIEFTKVYSSDLIRAIQTADIALPQYEKEQSELLREVNVGILEGKSPAKCREIYGDVYAEARKKRDFTPFKGESNQDQYDRVVKFLKALEQSFGEEDVIAVFCHEGSVKNMFNYVLNINIPLTDTVLNNGAVTVFDYTKDKWKLVQYNIY